MFRLYAKLKSVKRFLKAKNIEVFGGIKERVCYKLRSGWIKPKKKSYLLRGKPDVLVDKENA